MKYELIREPYIYGWEIVNGDKKAQAVQCYEGQWISFFFVDGKIMHMGKRKDGQEYISKSEAMKEGRLFVTGKPVGTYENI